MVQGLMGEWVGMAEIRYINSFHDIAPRNRDNASSLATAITGIGISSGATPDTQHPGQLLAKSPGRKPR